MSLQALWHTLREQHPAKAIDESDPEQASLIPLVDHALITVSGQDAEAFLQGQCTCDFKVLALGQIVLGAHCTPKGRMNCSFQAAYLNEGQTIGLRVHHSIAELALAALKKYAVFSKVTLEISTQHVLFAVFDTNATSPPEPSPGSFTHHTQSTCLRHDEALTEYWVKREDLAQHLTQFTQFTSLPIQADDNLWQLMNIRRGIAEVQAPLQERLLPQEMNYQLTGGVSFKKGCYTGQEIVARLHYRGNLKKHMARALIESDTPPTLGESIVASADTTKAQGTLLNLARLNNTQANNAPTAAHESNTKYEALILCDDSLLDSNHCTLQENTSAKIQWLPLPYAIN